MRPTMSEEELKWQRRDDAYTLARAEQIKADKERYNGAILGAKEIAQEEIARVQGIAKVAGMKAPKTLKAEPQQNVGYVQKVVSNEAFTFAPRRNNPATVGRLW